MNARRAASALAVLALLAGCARFGATPADEPAGTGVRPVDVWIDAGHGGRDPGNLGASRDPARQEKQLVLAVSRHFRQALDRRGYDALLVRDDDRFLTLGQRSRIANGEIPDADGRQARGRLVVSLHLNGSIPSVVGTESFWARAKARAAHADSWREDSAVATAVHAGVAQALGRIYGTCSADRSVREAGYSVLRRAEAPAVLVEMGFVTNACQQSAMSDGASQKLMAEALAQGVRYALAPRSEGGRARPELFELPEKPPAEDGRGPAPAPAGAAGVTLDERFETAAFPPRGWTLERLGADSTQRWSRRGDLAGRTSHVAWADGQQRGADAWLVSPALALADSNAVLEFAWSGNRRTTAAVLAECRVLRSGDTRWERAWSLRGETPGPEFAWRTERVSLADWAGATVRIAFRAAGGRGADFAIDDVRVGRAADTRGPGARVESR